MEKEADEEGSVSVETFNQFKWELKRHMVVEETAIFMHYDPVDEESYTMVPKLEKEHKTLTNMIDELENALKNAGEFDTLEFRDFIRKHKEYEEEVFYPTLERELDSGQKNRIIEHINAQI
jgi:hemerythrin-like domain-containing protein